MYRVSLRAHLPIEVEPAFEGILAFESALTAAPAVTNVTKHGNGGPGTRYEIAIERFGRSAMLETTVTEAEAPHRLAWEGRRPVNGVWNLESTGDGTNIEIVLFLDPYLVSTIPIAGALAGFAAEHLLARALRREVNAVLAQLVRDTNGDVGAIVLDGPDIVRE